MTTDAEEPRLWPNRFADAVGPSAPGVPDRDHCDCLRHESVAFHRERQDTSAPGWLRLLALIDEAVADGRPVFQPFTELSPAERREVVTLPASIGRLTEVRHLVLYGTNLVRLPAEIGAMANLRRFEPYTSRRLHWYPYELTRCRELRASAVSTRALYGNYKHRPPFPALRPPFVVTEPDPAIHGADAISSCSVCDQPLTGELHQVWLSRPVGTDVLPLLVNACSPACVAALPAAAEGYVPTPHHGGPGSGGRAGAP
ncbi:leucine-rich repeat domain-containing protein [Actinoplanes awajinensis]|uniref:leucine-rich repeat domain-containing protein n=1 Tax=Actinoplanes awajinensis TaxID=135946 RepID=UPI000AB4092F|nr:leucine-rich repeat domain-containing protein [Actinoplanes awajinensis]